MSGDQSILKLHGACARPRSPTTLMSTPIERIQSGIASHTNPSGSPEENDWSATDAVLHDVIALSTPCRRSPPTLATVAVAGRVIEHGSRSAPGGRRVRSPIIARRGAPWGPTALTIATRVARASGE